MSESVHFSKLTDQWFTPARVIELARLVLGEIELDPASSALANERIKAHRYYDLNTNGLKQSWEAKSIFINPPGGRLPGCKSLPTAFWIKLMKERPNFGHAICVCYSIEQLQTFQGKNCSFTPFDFTICFPKKRLNFYSPERNSYSPTHANAIVYVPSKMDKTQLFTDTFRELGAVK